MQRNPEELYELGPAAPDLTNAPMLHYLEGFIDAGGAGRLLADHLLRNSSRQTVAQFDTDRLLDYRSRRPLMTYDNSHWESYEAPELALHLLRDTAGRPFLLLTGPEPDHEWKLFTDAVLGISAQLGAGVAISFLGIPAGMPHTRPLGVIAHATRDDLVSGHQRLLNRIQLPGSAAALLELRLGQEGRDAMGFAVQVPHYLAQAVYPAAALALLGSVTTAAGLELPDGELREASERTNEAIERQVAESEEVAELVRALEQQYDAAAETLGAQGGRGVDADGGAGLLSEGEPMPTADEIAAQFERFLAENQGRPDPPGPPGSPDH
jgi:proteasome assembly chaperone (PAC2) family protein